MSSEHRRRQKSSVEQRREQLRGLIGLQVARIGHSIGAAARFVVRSPAAIVDGLRLAILSAAAFFRLPGAAAAAARRKKRSVERRPQEHSPWLVGLVSHWRLALGGVPALAALVGVVVLSIVRLSTGANSYLVQYIDAANNAMAARDFPRAAICYERALTHNPGDPNLRYAFAIAVESLGENDRAASIMRELAPTDRAGYGRAHWWQASKLMQTAGTADPQTAKLIESHLLRARQASPDLAEWPADTARFYLSTGRLDAVEAESKLLGAVRSLPDLRLKYAKLLVLAGRVGEARNEATSLLASLREAVAQEPAGWERRVLLAEAYAMLRQFGPAIDTLRQASALTNSEAVVRSMAQTFGAWMDVSGDDRKALDDVARRALEQLGPRAEDESTAMTVTARAAETLGRHDDAERRYRRAAELKPLLRFDLVRYYQRRNRTDDARREASQAVADAESAAAGRPGDFTPKLLAADAALTLKDYQRAIDLLSAVAELTPANLENSISRVYTAWWRDRRQSAPAEDSWPLVEKALAADPWNVELLKEITETARGDGPQAKQADAKLREMLARSDAPASLHLVVGTDALLRGDTVAARTHLVQAISLDGTSLEAANNLAWALVHSDKPDPQAALELINFALARQPGMPNFLDTRGHVYMAMERWQDALVDFEACRAARQGDPAYHRALATTYRKLGLAEMAAEHERMSAGEEAKPK
jgi:tetratricopeptide (TPR) repeat protein